MSQLITNDAELVSTVDATNLATAITLINDQKAKYNHLRNAFNVLIMKMRAREIVVDSQPRKQ